MKTARLLLIATVAWAVCVAMLSATPVSAAESNDSPKIRVLVTYGGHGFQREPFFAMFDAMEGIEYDMAELPKQADMLKPGLEKKYDVIARYDMVGAVPEEQRKQFVALLEEGIGLVSMHHNLGAHRSWDKYTEIIGGKFVFKPQKIDGKQVPKSTWAHGQTLDIQVAKPNHSITRGVEDFSIHDETYGDFYTSPEVTVLLTTDNPKNDPEIGWTTSYGNSRVFYFMLGHDGHAFENPNYRKLLKQGIVWAAGRE